MELRNLGIYYSGFDSPSTFSSDELNEHFIQVSFDPQAAPISDYLDDLAEPKDYFPRFSFREVTMDEINRTIAYSESQARGTNNVPQSFISAVTPVIGPHLLKIFNCFLSESTFPLVWKRSLVFTYNNLNSRSMHDIRLI